MLVTLRLVERHEGVDAAEAGPGYRDQLGCRIQFHGAGTERNHAAIQGQVLVGQLAHVAHQVGFGMVAIEHRMGQVVTAADQVLRQRGFDSGVQLFDRDVTPVVVRENIV